MYFYEDLNTYLIGLTYVVTYDIYNLYLLLPYLIVTYVNLPLEPVTLDIRLSIPIKLPLYL